MTLDQFRAAITIMRSLDATELARAGVIENQGKAWQRYASNPTHEFLRMDNICAERLWGIVRERMDGT